MATIKSYTDISQSKKLAKILPLESADAFYLLGDEPVDIVVIFGFVTHKHLKEQIAYKRAIPCWSLSALLSVLPKYELNNFGDTIQLDVNLEALATEGDETLLDLVVNMIIHLHEIKKL